MPELRPVYYFEWDPLEARANLRKHGVAFEEASTVFLDPARCHCMIQNIARLKTAELRSAFRPLAGFLWFATPLKLSVRTKAGSA